LNGTDTENRVQFGVPHRYRGKESNNTVQIQKNEYLVVHMIAMRKEVYRKDAELAIAGTPATVAIRSQMIPLRIKTMSMA
jgi:hypothetical protein